MPKIVTPLTAAQVKAKRKRPGTYNVGGAPGLLLQVTQHGAASWILRATMNGRVRSMGLGSYYKVSLEQARDAAREAHVAIAQGRDPIAERKAEKRERKQTAAEVEKTITFRAAAKRFFRKVKSQELGNAKARAQWLRTLELHTFDVIGDIPVREIGHDHVMAVLEPLWPRPVATEGLRPSIQAVLDWSRVRGYREGDNPALWSSIAEAQPGLQRRASRGDSGGRDLETVSQHYDFLRGFRLQIT